ncbi:MAG: hypothetical protein AAGJ35_02730 [Myxococcota bacterium]
MKLYFPPQAKWSAQQCKAQSGVTIMEWMIAMSMILVAATASIGMQYSTLRTHKISDDILVANNLALQASELFQVDATMLTDTKRSSRYFDLGLIDNNAGKTRDRVPWMGMTDEPLNYQWSSKSADGTLKDNTSTERWNKTYHRARYCIYYSYRWAGTDSTAQLPKSTISNLPFGYGKLIEVNLVVAWPYSLRGLPKAQRDWHKTCSYSSGTFLSDKISTMIQHGALRKEMKRWFKQVRHSFYVHVGFGR